MQKQIARAVAPEVDWDHARQQNAQDPMVHFATENLGAALRDQDIPPDRQRAIRALATAHGVHPDLADHIANQAVGAQAVKDLTAVIRGGKIGQSRAETLKAMGFLQASDPSDPTAPLHVTEDAQRLLPPGVQKFVQSQPDIARYNHSPDPAHGSVLYQNAVAGMERFSKTAERMLPRQHSEEDARAAQRAAEKIRDDIGATLADRYPQVLASRLAGHSLEEIAARLGITPENAARAWEEVATHVGRMMRARGVSAEDAEKALAPKPQPSAQPAPTSKPAGEDRNAIAAQAAQLRQQYPGASEADKPSIREQYRTLKARANIVDAVNEPDRNAKGQAFQRAAPDVIEAARQQVREFASKFERVFAGADTQTETDGTGGVSYNKAANRLQVSWNEIHNSAGTAYSNALRAGATVEQAREAATGKIRSILDEELRHVADVRANGDAATKALWESLPPEIQDATKRVYSRDKPGARVVGMSGTQLGYEYKRILSQNEQTGEVSELAEVTKDEAEKAPNSGDDGWVRQVMRSLKRMGNWLRGNGGGETARQLDALRVELEKITAREVAVAKDTATLEAPRRASAIGELENDAAETLASSPSGGTKIPEPQVTKNARQGKRFEQQTEAALKLTDQNVQGQVTIETQTSTVRIDHISTDSATGAIKLTESKSSAKAPLTKAQKPGYRDIEQTGGTIKGEGKPGYPGGARIPPTKVDIVRPPVNNARK
jgi:hypothetical protein